MSEGLYAEPDFIKKVHCAQDDKESIVDIYVSAESLRVYDNPWVEGSLTQTPGPAGPQHSVLWENSVKRSHVRTDSVLLGVVCLLLLVGIIYLGVQISKNKTRWERERKQLEAEYAALRRTNHQLRHNNTELNREREDLKKSCGQNPNKNGTVGQYKQL